jgi:hypothetical protein
MLPRKVVAVAVVMAAGATAEVATEAEATEVAGIFMVVAMAGGISAAVCISVAGATSAAGGTLGADRLRDRVFAAIVLSPSITPDRLPCGR